MDEWLRDDLELEGGEPEPEGVEHGLSEPAYLEDEDQDEDDWEDEDDEDWDEW